jgi:hypothetical protein
MGDSFEAIAVRADVSKEDDVLRLFSTIDEKLGCLPRFRLKGVDHRKR